MRMCALVFMVFGVGVSVRAEDQSVPDTQQAIATILAVQPEGGNNADVATAWKALVSQGEAALLPTLNAFAKANETSANWLRSAVDAIAEAKSKKAEQLNSRDLETFIKNVQNNPDARRIAYELFKKQEQQKAESLLTGFINDPSLELRRDAIAAKLKKIQSSDDRSKMPQEFQQLFLASRDKDQVLNLAELLAGENVKVNVFKHYGVITQWHCVGPFDNKDGVGYGKSFPPEGNVDLKAEYPNAKKPDGKITWVPLQSSDKDGIVDLNAGLGKAMDATGYALATVVSSKDQECEIRMESANAVKVFVNGKEFFARESYHHGSSFDQHIAKIALKKGENKVLLKICQNNMPYSWAQDWSFSARICDITGGAIPLKQVWGENNTLIETGNMAPETNKEKK